MKLLRQKRGISLTSSKIATIAIMLISLAVVVSVLFGGFDDNVVGGIDEVKEKACEQSPQLRSCQVVNCDLELCSPEEQEKWIIYVNAVKGKNCNVDECSYFEQATFDSLTQESLNEEQKEKVRETLSTLSQNSAINSLSIRDTSFDLEENIDKMPYEVKLTYERLENIDLSWLPFSDSAADLMIEESINQGLNPAVVLVVITQESLGIPNAVSHTGCVGLMQFCYTTALDYPEIFDGELISACHTKGRCDEDDRNEPDKSIKAGSKKLSDNARGLNDNLILTLVAYNAGYGIARKCKDVSEEEIVSCVQEEVIEFYGNGPKYAEVSTYISRISGNYQELVS